MACRAYGPTAVTARFRGGPDGTSGSVVTLTGWLGELAPSWLKAVTRK